MKILLADPPALEMSYDASYPNLGLLYLAGFVRKYIKTHKMEIEYVGPRHTLKSHLEFLKNFSPDIYGISFTSKTARLAYRTMEAVKTFAPSMLVVCGGAHPTAVPAEVMAGSSADVCVIGEGETSFLEIVKAVANNGRDFSKVAGIAFRIDDTVVFGEARPFIVNIDDIPLPAWDLIDFNSYPGLHLKKMPTETSMLISRGCPYDCVFCSNPVWKSAKPWHRFRSAPNICDEIRYLYSRGVREIYMTSDEINFNEEWAIELCTSVAQLGYKDLIFQCNMRADKVSDNLARALSKMNCWLVHLGIESVNDRVLKGIGKHVSISEIREAVRILSSAGIKIFAFMMLYQVWEEDGTLMFETHKEVDNSIRVMKELFNKKQIHYMSWQFPTPLPGSRLFKIAKKHNLFSEDPDSTFERYGQHDIMMNIPGLTTKAMRRRLKKGILLKDWFMIRSGAISISHMWRAWENIKSLIK